jgi:hypothetical protein
MSESKKKKSNKLSDNIYVVEKKLNRLQRRIEKNILVRKVISDIPVPDAPNPPNNSPTVSITINEKNHNNNEKNDNDGNNDNIK